MIVRDLIRFAKNKEDKGRIMHAVKLLQKKIEKSCPNIHKKRAQCLFDVVFSLVDCVKLWISALGRSIANQKIPKHNIKKVDCLVGNKKLHKERDCLYSYVAKTWIGTLHNYNRLVPSGC